MKTIPLLLLILISGCGPTINSSNSAAVSVKTRCPDQAQGSLDGKNVKSISFISGSIQESGQINTSTQKGFSFDAKKGNKFSFKTKDDLCVWVYTPSNTLISGDAIPVDGRYTIQISTLKGSTSFTLDMELKDLSTSNISTASTPTISSENKSATSSSNTNVKDISSISSNTGEMNRTDPELFIQNHYAQLNNRNYDSTWKALSSDFQSISNGFSSYTDWWDSVEKIKLYSTRLVSKNGSQAVVDAQLQYVMKRGGVSDDERGRIYLAWDSEKRSWEIIKKTSP